MIEIDSSEVELVVQSEESTKVLPIQNVTLTREVDEDLRVKGRELRQIVSDDDADNTEGDGSSEPTSHVCTVCDRPEDIDTPHIRTEHYCVDCDAFTEFLRKREWRAQQ